VFCDARRIEQLARHGRYAAGKLVDSGSATAEGAEKAGKATAKGASTVGKTVTGKEKEKEKDK
jgi:hypothetical protein